MSTTIITSAKAAMSLLVVLYTEHEAVCNEIEDLEDRGTKKQQRPLKGLIRQAERLAALETKAVELVLALDPSLVDICGVYDTVDEIIDGTTYGGGK